MLFLFTYCSHCNLSSCRNCIFSSETFSKIFIRFGHNSHRLNVAECNRTLLPFIVHISKLCVYLWKEVIASEL